MLNVLQVCCPNGTTTNGSKLSANDLPVPYVCGYHMEDRIISGREAQIYDFPWVALIEYTKRKLIKVRVQMQK